MQPNTVKITITVTYDKETVVPDLMPLLQRRVDSALLRGLLLTDPSVRILDSDVQLEMFEK